MIDKLIRYPIYLASASGIAFLKTLVYAPFISTLANTLNAILRVSKGSGASENRS